MTTTGTTRTAVFSDVDETLIRVKSMFRFLRFHLRSRGEPEDTYQRLAGELQAAALRGAPRSEINRRYYGLYRGESARRLAESGRRWYLAEWRDDPDGLFVPQVEDELRRLRKEGRLLVLVSGSFFACLDPVAEDIGADHVLATRPVIRRGELTGEVLVPMIGAAKGRAVRAAGVVAGVDLTRSSAYGDHISDVPMLEAVGCPVVVGDDGELAAHARRNGWARLLTGRPR
ncbi:HAD-IB family hydrolase [Streptomyces sp. NPDC048304]|uniref:HAD family hydrolase n=1 Tax=Streptomyces sp. NPDC048304 TaxID=3154820 RepID=UPI0033E7AE6B